MFYFFAGGSLTPFKIKEKNISYISEIIKTLVFLISFVCSTKVWRFERRVGGLPEKRQNKILRSNVNCIDIDRLQSLTFNVPNLDQKRKN